MSQVAGDVDPNGPVDVPTMMKMLMLVYNNVREDEAMEEVAEAVGDAICLLGDLRTLAQQVMMENASEAEFTHLLSADGSRRLC